MNRAFERSHVLVWEQEPFTHEQSALLAGFGYQITCGPCAEHRKTPSIGKTSSALLERPMPSGSYRFLQDSMVRRKAPDVRTSTRVRSSRRAGSIPKENCSERRHGRASRDRSADTGRRDQRSADEVGALGLSAPCTRLMSQHQRGFDRSIPPCS
jgi:hypothetical protein